MFEKSFVINLPFKSDRLEQFLRMAPQCFGQVEVWPAVHGDAIHHPDWWTSGAGAWGCYRSHLQILEHCYQNRIESYIVFEDDAIFRENAKELTQRFMAELPADWQMVYLGGQLLHEIQHPPTRISSQVFVPYNVNRTHCFAVHQRGYEILYRHLFDRMTPRDHIDHHLGRLHEKGTLKLYCPAKWIVGQDGGPSNISGKQNAATFWIDPEKYEQDWKPETSKPCVFLQSSLETAIELERRGWHRGHWQNEQRLDRGVCSALTSLDVKDGLRQWYKAVLPEAVREGKTCVCLFHPTLTLECVSSLNFDRFVPIQAESPEDAERQLTNFLIVDRPREQGPEPLKNLIYHIYPRTGNGTWQWNVEQLLKRIELFDGMRSVAVVTDGNSDSLEDVQKAFFGVRIDNWITTDNDPHLGEVKTFRTLLDSALKMPGITFYGHAKGVSYNNPNETREWTDMMYQVNLDDMEHVLESLKLCPITGAFTNTEWHEGNKHGWHYSGTFFWFRNADIAQQEWPGSVMHSRWGVELWAGSLYPLKDVGVLFGQNCGRMYNRNILDHMKSWMNGWKNDGRNFRPKTTQRIPIYINSRNLLTPLQKMIDYLKQIPNATPIIVDNDSTYPPLLDWYETCGVQVIKTGENGGKFGWSKHLLDHTALGVKKYVVTDPDLDLTGIPPDVLNVLSEALDLYPEIEKVGLSLDLDSIPNDYPYAEEVRQHESQFWKSKRGHFWEAGIDTTFAMRRATDEIDLTTWGHLRADRPYTAIHWPWTWTESTIEASDEIQHYIATADSNGLHWSHRHKKEPAGA